MANDTSYTCRRELAAICSDGTQGGDFTACRGIREQARSYRAVFRRWAHTDPIQTDSGERFHFETRN